MSYSFALVDGDLSAKGSLLNLVRGKNKLRQDIDMWLREIYRVNRFHPTYGSVLESYVGKVIGERVIADIEAEVHRVLINYQNLQLRRLSVNPSKYSPDELLHHVVSVSSSVSFDTVAVTVIFQSGDYTLQSTNVSITA